MAINSLQQAVLLIVTPTTHRRQGRTDGPHGPEVPVLAPEFDVHAGTLVAILRRAAVEVPSTALGPARVVVTLAPMAGGGGTRQVGPSRDLDRTFKVTIVLKGLDGLFEAIGGAILLFVQPRTLDRLAHSLTQHELSQDPHDFFATHVLHSTGHLTRSATVFAAIYLLSHGVAKVFLVVEILRDRLWAYPGMIALLLAFIAYQLYRLAQRVTVGLLLLTAFDALVVWLTWREYVGKRAARNASA